MKFCFHIEADLSTLLNEKGSGQSLVRIKKPHMFFDSYLIVHIYTTGYTCKAVCISEYVTVGNLYEVHFGTFNFIEVYVITLV